MFDFLLTNLGLKERPPTPKARAVKPMKERTKKQAADLKNLAIGTAASSDKRKIRQQKLVAEISVWVKAQGECTTKEVSAHFSFGRDYIGRLLGVLERNGEISVRRVGQTNLWRTRNAESPDQTGCRAQGKELVSPC